MRDKNRVRKPSFKSIIITLVIVTVLGIPGYYYSDVLNIVDDAINAPENIPSLNIEDIPKYDGKPYVIINNNEPDFDLTKKYPNDLEEYSRLDSLGRCGVALANISTSSMPNVERGSIGSIKPSGWHTVKYSIVDGKYLYNRCHLIGYQLAGENANELNLITCTRYMNTVGMLEFENKVAEYVKNTNNHVLYRVTPIFEGNNLLATGVQMEAYSIEDNGKGIKFNVFVYNVQDGIYIDYRNGYSEVE